MTTINTAYFKSNEHKNNFEQKVGEICNENPSNFVDVLNQQSATLSDTYLNNTKIYTHRFEFTPDTEQTDRVKIDVKTNIDHVEQNRQKLRKAINDKKFQRGSKKIPPIREDNSDLQITNEMYDLYKKACKKFSTIFHIFKDIEVVPGPAMILRNIESYKKDTMQRIFKIYLMKELSQKQKNDILNHPFVKYMMIMTKLSQQEIMQTLMEMVKMYRENQQTDHVHGENCNHEHDDQQVEQQQVEHVHGENCNHEHDQQKPPCI